MIYNLPKFDSEKATKNLYKTYKLNVPTCDLWFLHWLLSALVYVYKNQLYWFTSSMYNNMSCFLCKTKIFVCAQRTGVACNYYYVFRVFIPPHSASRQCVCPPTSKSNQILFIQKIVYILFLKFCLHIKNAKVCLPKVIFKNVERHWLSLIIIM